LDFVRTWIFVGLSFSFIYFLSTKPFAAAILAAKGTLSFIYFEIFIAYIYQNHMLIKLCITIINYFVTQDFRGTCSLFICRNVEGVHAHVSECLRGTWETKI